MGNTLTLKGLLSVMSNKKKVEKNNICDLFTKHSLHKHSNEDIEFAIKYIFPNQDSWTKGRICVSDLLNMQVHPYPWIKKLLNMSVDMPIKLIDIRDAFIKGHIDKKQNDYKQIIEIKECFMNNNQDIPLYIIILRCTSPYLLYDGNHRLIALSLLEYEGFDINTYVDCYLG